MKLYEDTRRKLINKSINALPTKTYRTTRFVRRKHVKARNNDNYFNTLDMNKLFKKDIIKNIKFKENRFGFEPEVTAKISRIKGIRIYEVGISYYGRSYEEGKKIGPRDGFRAIYCILKYNLFSR